MSWKDYEFEIPLEASFPEKVISEGLDWISDCEEDSMFGLNPVCFQNKNQYDAALKLCKACAGWYYFDNEEEKQLAIESARAVVTAKSGDPMWYFNIWNNTFDWVSALRDNNEQYAGQLYDIDSIWELFQRTSQRSYIEKADCFEWLIGFFAENLKFDTRHELQNGYVQCFDNHIESILYLRPDHAEILTTGVTALPAENAASLSGAAAGLIRMGKRELGMSLYTKLFDMAWTRKSTTDEKKNVVDNFLNRLSAGYESDPYIDNEIAVLLEEQSKKYSDAKWTAKIKTTIGRHRL